MDEEELYAHEKIDLAVETLATGPGEIRERLYDAFLNFHTLQVTHFADERIKILLDRIMKSLRLIDIAPRDQGIVQASLAQMSDDVCVEIANDIWNLYDILKEKRAEHFHACDDESHQEPDF